MNLTTILTFIACICFIFIIGRLFIIPLKFIFKLILNSILGGLLIFIINFLAQGLNFHIGLNLFTSIFVGFLGIPRCSNINTNSNFLSMIFVLFFILLGTGYLGKKVKKCKMWKENRLNFSKLCQLEPSLLTFVDIIYMIF